MNTWKQLDGLMSVILISITVTGCASFAKHKLPETGKLQPPADVSQAVDARYQFVSGHDNWGKRIEDSAETRQLLDREFVDQLKESGYFATLRPGKGEGIQIEADMFRYSNVTAVNYVWAAVAVSSLTAIPFWGTEYFRLAVEVASTDGKQFKYVLDDAATTIIWFPMFLAMPFAYPVEVYPDVRKNMYRNLVLEMQQDGLLPAANNQPRKAVH